MTIRINRIFAHIALSTLLVMSSIFILSTAVFAGSEGVDISAQETFLRLQQDDILVVDVRNEDEWRHSGLAQSAVPISMQDPQFMQKIMKLRMQHPGKDIAFICASSRRSGLVQNELAKRGFDGVYSVYGGMTGNGKVPGWIVEGLPVSPWPGNN